MGNHFQNSRATIRRPKICISDPPPIPPPGDPNPWCITKPTDSIQNRNPGTQTWANRGRVRVCDNNWSKASNVKDDDTHWLACWAYGFVFPRLYDQILGIIARCTVRAEFAGNVYDQWAELTLDNGISTIPGSDRKIDPTIIGTGPTIIEWGGETDLWNAGLTISQMQNSQFGVRLKFWEQDAIKTDIEIDCVSMTMCLRTQAPLDP